jgi:hypothetical protein
MEFWDATFEITTWNGKRFKAVPEVNDANGKMTYWVEVQGKQVMFGGNPEIGELLIVPYAPPADLEPDLLVDIARAIERAMF